MSSINGTNIERMRVNGNEIALAKINGNVVFQKNKLLKTFFGDSKQNTTSGKNIFNIYKFASDNSDYYHLENEKLICDSIDLKTQGFVYTPFEKGTYTLSTTNVCNISVYEENSIYFFIQKQNVNSFTFTLEENKNLHFKFFSNDVPYEIGNIQIEKGPMVTEYEPYTGGKPSPSPDYPQKISSINGVNLKLVGKNLFDKNTQNFINGFLSDTRNTIVDSNNVKTFFIPCNPNSIYTISKQKGNYFRVATTIYEPSLGISLSQIIVNNNSSSITINTNNDSKYLLFNVYDKTQDFVSESDMLNSIQLEKGSQVTTYEPHKNQTIPINLQENILAKVGDYADELQVYSNGDIVLNQKIEKIIFNGSENWIISSLNLEEFSSFYIENILDYNNGEDDVPMICDYFIQKDFVNWEDLLSESFIENASNTVGIRLPKKIASTLEEFKNWLQSNNIEVYYVLQNSTTIKVDNIKEELNSFGDYSNIEIETTYS